MKVKKVSFIFIVLLLFSLVITSCNTAQRPNVPDNNTGPEPIQNNTNTGTDEPRVENDGVVNDKRTKDNIMPNPQEPATPDPTVGFALDQINRFDLGIDLVNQDKIYMKYKKGPSNGDSKVETILDGKKQNAEHEEASRQIEELLRKIPGASISDVNRIVDGTLSALKIKREDVIEFDMEFIFESGEKVEIELNKD